MEDYKESSLLALRIKATTAFGLTQFIGQKLAESPGDAVEFADYTQFLANIGGCLMEAFEIVEMEFEAAK